MFGWIFLLIAFYIFFKVVKVIGRMFSNNSNAPAFGANKPAGQGGGAGKENKYKDVEEVDFKEIKEDK
jgi:hypothetical protein